MPFFLVLIDIHTQLFIPSYVCISDCRLEQTKRKEGEANTTNDVMFTHLVPTETVVLSLFSVYVCILIEENTKGVL